MASIYESTPGQIALTGPQRSAGFNPVEVFDPSSQFLREADRRTDQAAQAMEVLFRNNQADLEALSGFSQTLNKFMVDFTKEKIDTEIKLGVADVLNGDLTIKEDVLNDFRTKTKTLESAAQTEIKVADELTAANPGLGETFRQENPVINAYRAYGQAVGKAQLAASQAEAVLGTFVRDRETKIPITLPDGTVRTITPATAQTQPELMAVWQVGIQRFMETAGIDNLNPVILSEHLTPVMLRVRSQVLGERMQEIARNRRDQDEERFIADTGALVSGFADPAQVQDLVATTFRRAFELSGGNWKLGNKLANDTVLTQILRLGATNPEEAKTALDNYEQSLINPDDPSLRTVGERFGLEIEEVRNKLNGIVEENAEAVEGSANEEIEALVNQFRTNPNPTLYSETERKLEEMAPLYPKATEALVQLRTFGKNYNPKNDEAVMDAINKGIIKSAADIQLLEASGHISGNAADRAKALLPSQELEALLPEKSVMRSFARDKLRSMLKAQGISDSAFADKVASTVSSVVDLAAASTLRELEGKQMNKLQAQSFMEQQIMAAFGPGGDFAPRQDEKTKQWILPTPGSLRGMAPIMRRVSGPSGMDLANQVASRLPRKVSGRSSLLLPQDRVELNIDVLNNGGKPSADLEVLARASNLSVEKLLEQQARLYGIQYTPSSKNVSAQRYSDNSSYDSVAAAALANPRITGRTRERFRLRLQRAKTGQDLQGQLTGEPGKALAALRTALGELEGGPGDAGYGGYNNGVAGSLRDPQLPKMTIAQVKQRGYLHNGKYQFKIGTLEAAQKLAGIPDTAIFDKATQDRLFDAVITEGFPWRKRLNAYLRGQNNDLRGAVEDLNLEWEASRKIDAPRYLRSLRQEMSGGNFSRAGLQAFKRQVSSITFERPDGQPGIDIYFENKQFPAVLPGRVKDINFEPGYGNYVVVESIDPETRQKVDVLYGHLASRPPLRIGTRVNPGQIIGRQGGTGNVRSVDGTIASIDFFAPAPAGSTSMTPYRDYDRLRRRIASQFGK